MKLYLWDQAARDFCKKFKSYESTPTVLLVTTVNTKTLGGSAFCLQYRFFTATYIQFVFFNGFFHVTTGTLALTSMSSSRVFMDYDVQPTIDYFSW